MLDNLKFPVYPGINDVPREPSPEQPGNGSDVVARFNQLIDSIDLPSPLVYFPFNGNLRNLITGNKGIIPFLSMPYNLDYDYVDTEFGKSLEIDNSRSPFTENYVITSDFHPAVGSELAFSAWIDSNLELEFDYYSSSIDDTGVSESTYIRGTFKCNPEDTDRFKLAFSSSYFNYRYRSSTDSLSSISESTNSSSSSSAIATREEGLNHVAITRSYEGITATTSFFVNGVKVKDWINTPVLTGRTQTAGGLSVGLSRGNPPGIVGQVYGFDRALSPEQIEGLYLAPKPRSVALETDLAWSDGVAFYVEGDSDGYDDRRRDGTIENPFSSLGEAIEYLKRKTHTNTIIYHRGRVGYDGDSIDLSGLKATNRLPYLGYNKNRIEIVNWVQERFSWWSPSSSEPIFYGQGDPALEILISNCDFVANFSPVLITGLSQGLIFRNCAFYPRLGNYTSLLLIENSAWVQFERGNRFINLNYDDRVRAGNIARGLDIEHNYGMVSVENIGGAAGLVFEDVPIPISLSWGARMTVASGGLALKNCPTIGRVDGDSRLDLNDAKFIISDRLIDEGGSYSFGGKPMRRSRLQLNFDSLPVGDRVLILGTSCLIYLIALRHNGADVLSLKKQIADESESVALLPSSAIETIGSGMVKHYDNNLELPPHLLDRNYKLILTTQATISNPVSIEIEYWAIDTPNLEIPSESDNTTAAIKGVPREGLTAYWTMDEASGDRADSTLNNHVLTPTGVNTFAGGVVERGVSFDRKSILKTSGANLLDLSTDFTITLWIRPRGVEQSYFFAKYDPSDRGSRNGIALTEEGSKFRLLLVASDRFLILVNQTLYTTGEYYFVSISHDKNAKTIEFGVNLNTDLTDTSGNMPYSFTVINNTTDVVFGGWGQGEYNAYADIDEVGIWNRVLTPLELANVYNNGSGSTYDVVASPGGTDLTANAGLQLWLDATDAETVVTSENSVVQWSDKSGNSRHATSLFGSPQQIEGAIAFDGAAGLEIPHPGITGAAPRHIFTYVKLFVTQFDNYTRVWMFGEYTNDRLFTLSYYPNDQKLGVVVYGTGNLIPPNQTFSKGDDWAAIEVKYDGNEISLYVDSVFVASKGRVINTADNLSGSIGCGRDIDRAIQGGTFCQMSKMLVYDRVLSEDERNQVYNYLFN